jgi:hypothetical protein
MPTNCALSNLSVRPTGVLKLRRELRSRRF